LEEAEVHRLRSSVDDGVYQYVLVDYGMDTATVEKVPQLHLARIFFDGTRNRIYGAKVINRTLGTCDVVCNGKLLDRVLSDATSNNNNNNNTQHQLHGWATLHGLSDYITGKDQQQTSYSSSIIQSIAANRASIETAYQEEEWANVCIDFIEQGLSKESNLYSAKGVFSHIEHHADTSDYSDTCGGSMAVYTFK
jgi:hypothetical protein